MLGLRLVFMLGFKFRVYLLRLCFCQASTTCHALLSLYRCRSHKDPQAVL